MKTIGSVITLALLAISPVLHGRQSEQVAKWKVDLGISYNPFLNLTINDYEFGPAVNVRFALNKRLEAGAGFYSRNVWFSPNNRHGQESNLRTPYDLENLYVAQVGYNFYTRRTNSTFQLVAGLRHELYKEILDNRELNIYEEYQLNEVNLMYALAYSFAWKISDRSSVSVRLMLPFNRNPQDDINRVSLEPAYRWSF